jgi:hypothetical protein
MEDGFKFSNDKLKVSILYYGDYKFAMFPTVDELKLYRSVIKPTLRLRAIRKNNTVYTNKTIVSPFLKSGLWYVNRTFLNLKKRGHELERMETSLETYYERKEVSLREKACWVLRLYPYNKGYLLFVFYSNISIQKETFLNLDELEQAMLGESNGIFSSMKLGDAY